MTLHWTKEDTPQWDADKQRLFGPDETIATQRTVPRKVADVTVAATRMTV
jgi:hypothetical protein